MLVIKWKKHLVPNWVKPQSELFINYEAIRTLLVQQIMYFWRRKNVKSSLIDIVIYKLFFPSLKLFLKHQPASENGLDQLIVYRGIDR